MPERGQVVQYVMEFDADDSYSPNIGPAIVTKVNSDGSVDVAIFAMNGLFFKEGVKRGESEERMTWHLKA